MLADTYWVIFIAFAPGQTLSAPQILPRKAFQKQCQLHRETCRPHVFPVCVERELSRVCSLFLMVSLAFLPCETQPISMTALGKGNLLWQILNRTFSFHYQILLLLA